MNMGKFLVQQGMTPRPKRDGFPRPMLGNTGTKVIWDDELREPVEVPAGRPEPKESKT